MNNFLHLPFGWDHTRKLHNILIKTIFGVFCLFIVSGINAQFSINFSITQPSCNNLPNGSITAQASGGVAPYSYTWNTGATGHTISGVSAGVYTVFVTDSNNNSFSSNVTLTQPDAIEGFLTSDGCVEPITISAIVNGGTTPYSYAWSTGHTTASITVNTGSYCVTITDANFCGIVRCIDAEAAPITIGVTANSVTCPQGNDGILRATPDGGAPPYTYQWSNGANTPTIANLAPGTYFVTILDANGCSAVTQGTVVDQIPLSTNINATDPICPGQNTGAVAVSASGGTPPYSYQWNTGQTQSALSGLAAGTYTVTIMDANGCDMIEQVVLTPLSNLIVGGVGTPVTCPGEMDGFATASATGGVPPYSYQWSNGGTTQVLTGMGPGVYLVTVTDAVGCFGTETITVFEPANININVSTNNSSNCGTGTGTAIANVSGGTAPYSYLWSTGSTSNTVTGLSTGNYSLTVTDAMGCQETSTFTITAPPDVFASATATPLVCPGANNGQATVSASGGTPPFTYAWNTGATSSTITGLGAGIYTVTVTDSNGCTDVDAVTIQQAPDLNVIIDANTSLCSPGETTTAVAIASGGTAPYTYIWNTGASTSVINGIGPGTYSVTVTDVNGCSGTAQITISVGTTFTIDLTVFDILCNGFNNGGIQALVNGSNFPYSYLWNTGATGAFIGDLPAGTYSVTVTDGSGCTQVASATVSEPSPLIVDVQSTDGVCDDAFGGSASATGLGGTVPYSYQWSTGATTSSITGLSAGSYVVTVTDANGCVQVGAANIESTPGLNVSIQSTDLLCGQGDTGFANAIVSGGTPPFTYNWATGATGPNIQINAAGTYRVTVTDANGCTGEASTTIAFASPFTVNLTAQDPLCANENSGLIQSNIVGGQAPYSYVWSTGSTTSSLNNIGAGTYSLTVTDANGCTSDATVQVSMPAPIDITLDPTNIVCSATNSGAISTTVIGGTAPYTFNWSNGATTANQFNLAAGPYLLTVTDANGCMETGAVTITQSPGLEMGLNGSDVTCTGANDGTATVNVTSGTGPFIYSWSNGGTTATITNLAPGAYTATVTSVDGCFGVGQILIGEPTPITVNAQAVDPICDDSADGTATAFGNGGTAPYTFVWSTGQTGASISGLAPGSYVVTISDANGCTATANTTVEAPPAIEVMVSGRDGSCVGESLGTATASATGGTAPYSFSWSDGQGGASINGLATGTYTVTVTDANGCTGTGSVSVEAYQDMTCEIVVIQEVSRSNSTDGIIEALITGGTPPYSYAWNNGQTTAQAINLPLGTYSVIITDANGCTTSCDISLTIPLIGNAKLGDYVWLDLDQDGIQDNNEPGIPNVKVILQTTDNGSVVNLDTTYTDNTGMYMFQLNPGDYKVTFCQPDGLRPTEPNQGGDDTVDSDADPDSGMSQIVTINDGDENLTIDAGFVSKCDNLTLPGAIEGNQVLCGPGIDAAPINNVAVPSGGSGAIEYLWMYSTESNQFNAQTWVPIPEATGPSYDPGLVYQTTYFARCARRECCTVYLETNIVEVYVDDITVAQIFTPSIICQGESITLTAGDEGADAIYEWTFPSGASIQTATGQSVEVAFASFGTFTVALSVTANGCTSSAIKNVVVTNNPVHCGNGLVIETEVFDQEQAKIKWKIKKDFNTYRFVVEHSNDASVFKIVGQVDEPILETGFDQQYEFTHQEPTFGLNYYRVKVIDPQGLSMYSEPKQLIIGDVYPVMIYPNPVTDILTLMFIDPNIKGMELSIFDMSGRLMMKQNVESGVQVINWPVKELPVGTYNVQVTIPENDPKIYKILKY